jgi:hypothetical protein
MRRKLIRLKGIITPDSFLLTTQLEVLASLRVNQLLGCFRARGRPEVSIRVSKKQSLCL